MITIVGGGQSGLQLGNGLLSAGYDVRLVQDRTGDDIRTGKVMSSQCMFDKALSMSALGAQFLGQGMPDGGIRRLHRSSPGRIGKESHRVERLA